MKIPTIVFSFLLMLGSTALADTRYVDINNATPSSPYTSWGTAATNIQDAVDAAVSGETVMVADGHYLLASEILVTNNITIQSVNGSETTIVDGQGIARCFNLGLAASTISGFSIINGYSYGSYPDGRGGGIFCSNTDPLISNCSISNNFARYNGGGIYYGTVSNSVISSNTAHYGAGIYRGHAFSCIISNNNTYSVTTSGHGKGGGMYDGAAYECLIIDNTSDRDGAA